MSTFKTHDVFISYAIEEKHDVAETLALCLEKKKIKVWYAGNELHVGDSISSVISKGLRKSKYFILILSPSYKRNWTFLELHTFIEKERQEKKILIFPVWHEIDYEEVKAAHPEIADRYAVSTNKGLEIACQLLHKSILAGKKEDRIIAGKKWVKRGLALLAFFAIAFFLSRSYCTPAFKIPSKLLVEEIIQKQTGRFQVKLSNELWKEIMIAKGKTVPLDSVVNAYNRFITTSDYERNDYRFTSAETTISGAKNLEALGIPVSNTPYSGYGISSPACYVLQNNSRFAKDTMFCYSFVLINQVTLAFSIDTLFESEGKLHVWVTYEQNIRSIEGDLMYPIKAGPIRKQFIQISGYKPSEEYIFEQKNGVWICSEVK
jgi:hypothetical protein